jgi:hypothetical protein
LWHHSARTKGYFLACSLFRSPWYVPSSELVGERETSE